MAAWRTVFGRAPAHVETVVGEANAAADEVLIGAGPLPAGAEARRRHMKALVGARVIAATAIVLAAVPPLAADPVATALPADPAAAVPAAAHRAIQLPIRPGEAMNEVE